MIFLEKKMGFMSGLAIIVSILTFFPSYSVADDLITGRYCLTYGDKESLIEARELNHTLAIRNAIESYRIYVESTGTVKNFVLTKDLVQILSSGYLKNIETIEYKEKGRTICETVRATVSSQDIEKVFRRHIFLKTDEEKEVENNDYVRILSVREHRSEKGLYTSDFKLEREHDFILVKVKILKKVLFTDEHCIAFATFYDVNGQESDTDRREGPEGGCRTRPVNECRNQPEYLYPGEVRAYKFHRRDRNTHPSYRIWFYADRERGSVEVKKMGEDNLR